MSKKQPTRGESLAKAIISEYKPKTVEDIQNALKDVSSIEGKVLTMYTRGMSQRVYRRPLPI